MNDGSTRTAKLVVATYSPFVFHAILTYATRRVEQVWGTFALFGQATDFVLPVLSAGMGVAILARLLKDSSIILGIVYVSIMVPALLYVAMFVFGYAWRDYP